MAISSNMYAWSNAHAYGGAIDWDSDTIKCALLKKNYTFNHAHKYFDNSVSNDIIDCQCPSSGNYTAGGIALGNKEISVDEGDRTTTLSADNVIFENLTQDDIKYAVIYKYTGNYQTSPVIAIINFDSGANANEGGFSTTNENLTIDWDSRGCYIITAST